MNLARLGAQANEEERRRLIMTILYAAYVDTNSRKTIVVVKPNLPFKPVF